MVSNSLFTLNFADQTSGLVSAQLFYPDGETSKREILLSIAGADDGRGGEWKCVLVSPHWIVRSLIMLVGSNSIEYFRRRRLIPMRYGRGSELKPRFLKN